MFDLARIRTRTGKALEARCGRIGRGEEQGGDELQGRGSDLLMGPAHDEVHPLLLFGPCIGTGVYVLRQFAHTVYHKSCGRTGTSSACRSEEHRDSHRCVQFPSVGGGGRPIPVAC